MVYSQRRNYNSYENKKKTIKRKIVHNIKLKKDYYKTLSKEGSNLKTPDFYQEIFEKDVPIDKEENDNNNDNDTLNEKEIDIDTSVKKKNNRKNNKINQKFKPNPFHKALHERERKKFDNQAKVEAAEKERKMRNQEKEKYHSQRKHNQKKFMKRNSKGQPLMKTRIDHLLAKIKEQK
ncbi:hypothetical protein Glove_593g10 [Diversispora epigaea]|uniref:rRNA-processing protein FYV7 n=1 Tax=Diversispora epigaea TaxID=1348612 RepID=A0A397GAJ9_9GLOM|nr:hypothetical protein Glove_593g10 [Diversispora epigaea]